MDVVLGVDDRTTVVAARLARELGLPHNSVESVDAARNKLRMRQLLSAKHVPVPSFSVFPLDVDPRVAADAVRFPCVVKPLILSASCGVIRADNRDELGAAMTRVASLLTRLGLPERNEAGRQLLVEDFIPGREVALEGLLTNGQLRVLALFDKPDPLDGPFFEETLYVTPSRLPEDVQGEIALRATQAARALGLEEGPVHGEFRINEQGVWVIELAARSIGGRCSQTLRFATDVTLEELILRHALRMELPSLDQSGRASGVMMLPIPSEGILVEVQGQEEARAVAGIEELTITALPGQHVVPLPEGMRYLGFLIARGTDPEEVESALREAHGRLTVAIRPAPTPSAKEDSVEAQPRVISF